MQIGKWEKLSLLKNEHFFSGNNIKRPAKLEPQEERQIFEGIVCSAKRYVENTDLASKRGHVRNHSWVMKRYFGANVRPTLIPILKAFPLLRCTRTLLENDLQLKNKTSIDQNLVEGVWYIFW